MARADTIVPWLGGKDLKDREGEDVLKRVSRQLQWEFWEEGGQRMGGGSPGLQSGP